MTDFHCKHAQGNPAIGLWAYFGDISPNRMNCGAIPELYPDSTGVVVNPTCRVYPAGFQFLLYMTSGSQLV
jgi:hypothetical protein